MKKMVKSFKSSIPEFKKNSKAAISKNKVEEVVIDNTVIFVHLRLSKIFAKTLIIIV